MSLNILFVKQPKKGSLSSLNSEYGDKVTLLRAFHMTSSLVETLKIEKYSVATLSGGKGKARKLLQCFAM